MDFLKKIRNFIVLMRPKQWFKSFYIIFGAAPAIFLMPTEPLLIAYLLFLGIFTMILVQGTIYALNDVADCENDKKHPVKKFRPVASGKITKKEALCFAILLFILACIIAWYIDIRILYINFAILILNIFYSFWPRFKDFMYLDIGIPALNFPLRVAVGWYLFEPYNYAKFSLDFDIISKVLTSNSIQAILFSSPPRIIEITIKFSSVTLSFVCIMLFTYFLACYLLAMKRLREKIEGYETSRKVLKFYSQAKLKAIAIVSGIVVFFSYIFFAWSLKFSLVLLSPILFYALIKYYKMAFESYSIVGKPEEIFRNREFQILFILTALFGIFLLFFF